MLPTYLLRPAGSSAQPVYAVPPTALPPPLSPPWQPTGPPAETVGGTWLVHLADGSTPSPPAMYLHEQHRLLVMGEQPLISGAQVRSAASASHLPKYWELPAFISCQPQKGGVEGREGEGSMRWADGWHVHVQEAGAPQTHRLQGIDGV